MLADDSVEATLDLVQVESSLPSTAVRVRARFPGSERARLRYPCVQGERVCVGGLSDWGACCVLCLYRRPTVQWLVCACGPAAAAVVPCL